MIYVIKATEINPKQNHQYKILPPQERCRAENEIRKPQIVTVNEKPITNIDNNIIYEYVNNAKPQIKKRQEAQNE